MTTRIRFALVGAGGIAQSYAQAFQGHPDAELAAVVDPRVEAAAKIADQARSPAFADIEDLALAGCEFEAVIISTPPNTHEHLATWFLHRGVHVWCEKPFAINTESAMRMVEAARSTRRLITMASKFRYVDDIVKARDLVSSGSIGDVLQIENSFTSRVDMSQRWNSNPAISGGGVIMDNGTHSVDIFRFFFGALHDVQAVEARRIQSPLVEDTARLLVRSASGILGSIDLSWSLNKQSEWFLNLYGTQGIIQIGWKQSRFRREGDADWTILGPGYDKSAAFKAQLANFARAIQGKEDLRITTHDAIASVEVVEAAYRSLNHDGWNHVQATNWDLTTTPFPQRVNREAAHA
jgi:predicted dehydrogenase